MDSPILPHTLSHYHVFLSYRNSKKTQFEIKKYNKNRMASKMASKMASVKNVYIPNNRIKEVLSFGEEKSSSHIKDQTTLLSNYMYLNSIGLHLTLLRIKNCHLEDDGIKILAQYLETNTTLENLYMEDSMVTYVGSSYLQSAIEKNNTLTYLQLSHVFYNHSPYKIIEALIKNKSIETLDLSNNTVYNSTFMILNTMLQCNTTLISIYFGDTLYDELFYGLYQLWSTTMITNTTLKKLHFSPNNILEHDIVQTIYNTILVNNSLIELTFANLSIQENSISRNILNQLKYNNTIYNNTFFSYSMDIEKFHPNMKKIIITILLCNSMILNNLYDNLWLYIFTFFQRKIFIL